MSRTLRDLTNSELLSLRASLSGGINNPISARKADIIESNGSDLKAAYHVVRLINEVEQILTTGDLDLESGREQLKAIRRGDWTMQQVVDYFELKEKQLEQAYADSELPHKPDEQSIKAILMNCIESHYGSIDKMPTDEKLTQALAEINKIAQSAL